MQSVMFNSQHISVSKDTLHSHEILRRPPEAKIASLLSQKDQKNEITHQRTSRAAVYLLDPLISCCNATTYSIDRAWPVWMWKELMLKTSWSYRHMHTHIVHTCTTGSFDTYKATSDIQAVSTSCHYSCSFGSKQMQIRHNGSGMAFACTWGKYHSINHVTKK